MPHVSGADLTARAALTSDDAAALALTLIEAAICPGVPDVLTQAEREVILSIARTKEPRRIRRVSCLELGAWPITGLLSVHADESDVTINCAANRFALYLRGVSGYDALSVRYVTGYAEGELPAPLKAAVVELGSRLLEGDLDVSKMSWESGLSADYEGATAETLPVSVRELIAPWTFGGFG